MANSNSQMHRKELEEKASRMKKKYPIFFVSFGFLYFLPYPVFHTFFHFSSLLFCYANFFYPTCFLFSSFLYIWLLEFVIVCCLYLFVHFEEKLDFSTRWVVNFFPTIFSLFPPLDVESLPLAFYLILKQSTKTL